MQVKLIQPEAICGCGSLFVSDYTSCCQVLDLGVVYEKEPEYSTDNPCAQNRIDRRNTETGLCLPPQFPPSPHGEVLEYRRACARLVVWIGARIIDGAILFDSRKILYSRQRKDLPYISNGSCLNPILCPPENGLSECCGRPSSDPADALVVAGPYTGCSHQNTGPNNGCELVCSGVESHIYKYATSNCELQFNDPDEGLKKVLLAGYAETDSWWFVGDSSFNSILNSIRSSNPHGENYQTIYAHFQVEWKPIECSSKGGDIACGGVGRINEFTGRCEGNSRIAGLVDKEEREKAVKITAAIGFSAGGCGYTTSEACSKIYN